MLNYITTGLTDKDSTIQDIVNTLQSNPLLNGRLIKDITVVSTSDKVIDHGLSKIPNGYIIVSKTAHCDLRLVSSDVLTITLRSSDNATLNLWVF